MANLMNCLTKTSPSRFIRNREGSAMIEYAIVAPVFFLLFLGVTEFGLFMYHKIAIERIAVDVSRLTSIGKSADTTGACSGTTSQIQYINCIVKEKSAGLINGDRIKVQVNTLAAGGTVIPDICLDDIQNPNSAAIKCTNYEESNGINGYQGAAASNTGGIGTVVQVLIYYPWSVQFPIISDFFGSGNNKGIVMITSSTIIKNEPCCIGS